MQKIREESAKRDLTELNKLQAWLDENHIPYKRTDERVSRYTPDYMDFHQIKGTTPGGYDWDAICHYGSYGANEGLLETMGVLVNGKDQVEGWLTADELIKRLKEHYGKDV